MVGPRLGQNRNDLKHVRKNGGFVVGAEPVGPVGIAQIAGTAKTSWVFFGVMAYSISLGVLNLLPVPLLTAVSRSWRSRGHQGSPVSDRIQQGAVQLGLLLQA